MMFVDSTKHKNTNKQLNKTVMKTIKIFVGNVTQIKQGDLLLIKSMLVEVTNVVHETFTVKIEAITNEGDSKEYTFDKEVFLNI